MNFKVFGVIFIAFFQVYASVYDTSDRHRRPSMCTSTSTWLVAALPVKPAGPAGVFGHLGASPGRRAVRQRGCWAGRRVRGRQTARVVSVSNSPAELVTFACLNVRSMHNKTDDIIVQEQAEDILVPLLLGICLTLYYISLF